MMMGHRIEEPVRDQAAKTTPVSPLIFRVAVMALILTGLLVTAIQKPFTIDDSFISFRAATRIATEGSFSWNPGGEPLETYSSPLWVLVLVPLAWADLPLVTSTHWLGGLFLTATALLVFVTLRSRTQNIFAGFVAALFLLSIQSIRVTFTTGMETGLYAFLITAACVIYSGTTPRPLLGGAILCLLSITRFEGFVLAIFILAVACIFQKRILKEIYIVAAFCFCFFIARYIIFGEWLPMPAHAKGGVIGELFRLRISRVTERTFVPALLHISDFFAKHLYLAAIVPLIVAARRDSFLFTIPVVFCIGIELLNGGDWMPHFRLLTPAIACLLLSLMAAIWSPTARQFATILLIIIGILNVTASRGDFVSASFNKEHLNVFTEIGRWLDSELQPGDVALLDGAGAISYAAPRAATIDFFGLLNKTVAKSSAPSGPLGKSMNSYTLGLRPTIIQVHTSGGAHIVETYYGGKGGDGYQALFVPRYAMSGILIFVRDDATGRIRLPTATSRLAPLDGSSIRFEAMEKAARANRKMYYLLDEAFWKNQTGSTPSSVQP